MKVGLVMIVKDEEAVIERALLSAKPFISTYVIVDTGSTDHTKEIIASVMSDMSGAVIDRPWVSFGHNRSEALALCDGKMDWAIMFDADDSLAGTVPPPSVWQTEVDGFTLTCIHSSVRHQRTQIFKTGISWAYEGAVHEYAMCRSKTAVLAALPPETYLITRCEGSRSKDPEKYLKDAYLLEKELLRKPDDHRTLFYLAQSYRDAGRNEEARRY
jgi:glycosyltransferase involved in cell wall biosynthesis